MVRPHSSLGYKPPAPVSVVIQSSQIQQVSLTFFLVLILGADHDPLVEDAREIDINLGQVNSMETSITKITVAKQAFAETRDLYEILDIRNKAMAMSAFADAEGAKDVANIAK